MALKPPFGSNYAVGKPRGRRVLVAAAGVALALQTVRAPAQNQALSLDGTGYVVVPTAADLNPPAGFTVEAWIRPSINPNPATIIRRDQGACAVYGLNMNSSTLHFEYHVGNGCQTASFAAPSLANSWHHVAGTHFGSVSKLYLDGNLVAQNGFSPGALIASTTELRIGKPDAGQVGWVGLIDEVRVWSTERSQAEIQDTMLACVGDRHDLVGSWRFDGDFRDLAGGHDGFPVGNVAFSPTAAPVRGCLHAPRVSAPGLTIVYDIVAAASQPYWMDVSVMGTIPGVAVPGTTIVLPLNPPFAHFESGGLLPNVFTGLIGVTDVSGHAAPSVHLPDQPWIIAYDLFAAYVLFDPYGPGFIGHVSNPVVTELHVAPELVSVNPPSGLTTGVTTVTLIGSGFASGATVTFGSTQAALTVVNSSLATCVAPPHAPGPVTIKVTNPDGLSSALPGGFTYVVP